MLGGTAHPKTGGFEVIERTSDIGDLRDRQVHDGAGRSLVAAHGHAGGALVGDDDARSAHNLGRTHDGAKVAVIGHVVEHHDKCRTLARAVEDIGDIRVGKVAHLERNALVSAMARKRIELCARHVLNADVRGVEVIDQKLKIDDPVGAIGVHFVNGALGTVLTGLFATDGGLFYGGGFGFLGVQMLGVLAVCAWVGVAITLVFFLLKKTIGLRVSREEEIDGLDIHEHGLISAYADFAPMSLGMVSPEVQETVEGAVPAKSADEAVPVVETTTVTAAPASGPRISKVVILLRQSRFDALKEALSSIGVTGLTVTQVLGCGVQKGQSEFYRGVPMDVTLLPKVKVEVVVSRVPVRSVIDVTKRVLYTGHIGDGKIFVYNVENVVKVRPGEEGVAALQDTH